MAEKTCQLCGSTKDLRLGAMVRPALAEVIGKATGGWNENGYICAEDLQKYRIRYLEELLKADRGEISALDAEVLESLRKEELLARDALVESDENLTFGERLADRVAGFGGSWQFLIIFALVVLGWMAVNSFMIVARPFDPYPYIFLNLVLSCLAAVQAPIIMMSQNRQEARDRARSTHDYQVNLKAEIEIRHLHQKLDHLMGRQWERMLEIQELQTELIEETRAALDENRAR